MNGRALPANWVPTESDQLYGLNLGLTYPQINSLAEDMRLWAAANANRGVGRKANWSAAFKGWMRRKTTGNGYVDKPNATMAALDRAITRAESRELEGSASLFDLDSRRLEGR